MDRSLTGAGSANAATARRPAASWSLACTTVARASTAPVPAGSGERSPEDRRRHIVEITPAGADRLREAEDGLVAVEDHVLAGLDEDERETLYGLLQRATSRHVLDCAGASRDWAEGTPPPG